jgi:hypothetical protein
MYEACATTPDEHLFVHNNMMKNCEAV